MKVTVETTIKGGLPVIATGEFVRCHPRNYPGHDHMEDVEVCWPSGCPIGWEISKSDMLWVEDELFDYARSGDWRYE